MPGLLRTDAAVAPPFQFVVLWQPLQSVVPWWPFGRSIMAAPNHRYPVSWQVLQV